jgi:hypothetical protein
MEREEQGCIVVAPMSVHDVLRAKWSCALIIITQLYADLFGGCILSTAPRRPDHMIMIELILQDHLVEMMAKRCLLRHLCMSEHPKCAQPMEKADLHDYHLNRRSVMMEGR